MNAANFLTIVRIALIPFIAFCFFYKCHYWRELAFGFFAVASISDYFDGWLARHNKTITIFGTIFDPIADKILFLSCLFLLVWNGDLSTFDTIVALILIWREMLISGLREGIKEKQIDLPVTFLSKVKTFLQLCAINGFISGEHYNLIIPAKIVLYASLILSLVTAYQYIKTASHEWR